MTEFIFLPDRTSDPEASFEKLSTAMSGAAKLSVSPREETLAATGFSDAAIASATRSIEAATAVAPDEAAAVEMIDFVQRSGVVLLRSDGTPSSDQIEGGSFVPVHLYRPAIADVRVGRSKLKLNSGPSMVDFLKINLRFSDNNAPVVGAVANLRRVGEEELSAVSDAKGVLTFALRTDGVDNVRFIVEASFSGHLGLHRR